MKQQSDIFLYATLNLFKFDLLSTSLKDFIRKGSSFLPFFVETRLHFSFYFIKKYDRPPGAGGNALWVMSCCGGCYSTSMSYGI